MNKKLLKDFAELAVKVGVNLQKGQVLVVDSAIECKEFARMVIEEGYKAGASRVIIRWSDAFANKCFYQYSSDEELQNIPDYVVAQAHYIVDNKAANVIISSPDPEAMKGIDPKKLQISAIASNKKMEFYRTFRMKSETQWCIVAYPNEVWAHKVFPDLPLDEAQDKLLAAILSASRVTEEKNAVEAWIEHMDTLKAHNNLLNQYHFKTLKFKNDLGTDLTIDLVDDHLWCGGGEDALNGVYFAPNIPTEETFTMPHKDKVNGKVVATKPLNYQGQMIEDFYLVFKDGAVVEYGAKQGEESLKSLIELDEGSKRLGEVALISHDSPISNMNILFYNTLFDENASCHLALGNAYTMNIVNGNFMSAEELASKGFNKSMTHVDFMFGSADMEITGICADGSEVAIFKKGNFVI